MRRVGLARQPRVPPRFPRLPAVLPARAAARFCPEVESEEGTINKPHFQRCPGLPVPVGQHGQQTG